MVERVPSSVSSGASQANTPQSPTQLPMDTPSVNQAAAEFASLMGAETPPQDQTNQDTSQSSESQDSRSEETEEPRQSDENADGEDNRTREQQAKHGRDREGRADQQPSRGQETQTGDQDAGAEIKPELATPGDAILQNLSRGEGVSSQAVQTPQPSASQSLEGIVQQVADQILVSDPSSGGREVRITLKDSILPGTEIRISQQAGKMQVQFVTDSAKSQELLAQNQAALQERLNEKISKHDVVVNVAFNDQGSGDQHDGRSRQQRNAQEEIEAQSDSTPD